MMHAIILIVVSKTDAEELEAPGIDQHPARCTLSEGGRHGINPVIKVKVIKVIKVFSNTLNLDDQP